MDVKLVLLVFALVALVFVNADLIYHNRDVHRKPAQKCERGASYYSNDPNANDTDIDVASDIESLLDYSDKEVCFYCICSTDGMYAGCLSRNPWYCEYFRYTRTEKAFDKRYGKLFQQERPSFFSQLSYRIRRTMDEGMFQMVQGFKPSGSRGGNEHQCVPFVSQYTDCTDENRCSGCKECICNAEAQWTCETISQCLGMDSRELDENSVDRAWESIEQGVKDMNRESAAKHGSPNIPRPQSFDGFNDELIAEIQKEKYAHSDAEAAEVGDFKEYIASQMDTINDRIKRSVPSQNDTQKVKFYHTVDEYNEDTLKQSNDSGTITANKVVPNLPVNVRRSGQSHKVNSTHPLQIEYNSPIYDHHIADNKIDSHNNEKHDVNKLQNIIGNKTKESKDKDLSKLIVNELKKGIEIVGDKNAPSISNITFVRENDTLTAMAFIAGNLLNKLWNMKQDNQEDSIETDVMKHEKIADLIELFKEPLTLRQETFLKDALEHLADTMSKGADYQSNIPLCQQVEKIKADLGISKNCSKHSTVENGTDTAIATENHSQNILRTEINNDASLAAVKKLNNVISLIRKYEEVQKNIKNIKTPSIKDSNNKVTTSRSFGNPPDKFFTKDENQSLNLYGSILDKITKLIVPKRKNKKILKAIKSQSIFNDDEDLKTKLKRVYDIDLENSTFTSKDKVVLDYLVNFRNKKCQLTENMYDPPSMEGGILQNLSEFLKVKSFVDLLNLLEPEKKTSTTESNHSANVLRSVNPKTTEAPVTITTILETTITTILPAYNVTTKDNLAQTKEKLKTHLKAIINDLLELQKASGMNSKDGNIKIAEALPCLYNLLNNNKIIEDKKKYRMNKIKSVFDAMKDELKYPDTRRFDSSQADSTEPRPKSAAVWERIIKNANAERNLKTRRNSDELSKSFEYLNILMQSMDDFSNAYKNDVILKGVIPRQRLSVLKTVEGDVRLYTYILEKIKIYLETTTLLLPEKVQTINEFLDNAMMNIDLDVNVVKNIFIHKERPKTLIKTQNYKKYQTLKQSGPQKKYPVDKTTTIKLSRDEIINQLIKNRVQFYLKVKELEGLDRDDDINVRLARKILGYLDVKNYGLARELFKVFVAQKQQIKTEAFSMPRPANIVKTTPRGTFMGFKEPLIQFEEEKGPTMGKDMMALTKALMKQLENIKTMKS